MAGMFDDLIPAANRPQAKMPAAQAAAQSPQRKAALDAIARQLQRTRELYNKNLRGVGPGSIMEFLPTATNQQFNSAAAGLSDQAQNAFRTPGVGSQSDRELAAFIAANQPSASDFDKTIEQKFGNIEGRLIPQRRALGLPDWPAPLAGDNSGWKIERVK